MSNIKAVCFRGWAPFNLVGNVMKNTEFYGYMQVFLQPVIGIKLEWTKQEKIIQSERGGGLTMCQFLITGQEAMQWGFFTTLYKMMKERGWEVEVAKVRDVEENTSWVDVSRM